MTLENSPTGFDIRKQAEGELNFLATLSQQRAKLYQELAEQALLNGDPDLALTYTELANLNSRDGDQELKEAAQIAKGEKRDGIIPTFTILPEEETGISTQK